MRRYSAEPHHNSPATIATAIIVAGELPDNRPGDTQITPLGAALLPALIIAADRSP